MSNFLDNDLKLILNFFGVSAFALIATVILHELGHLIALFIAEGKLGHLRFHPFEGAQITHSFIDQKNAIFVTSGGFLFGTLLGGFLTLVLWKFRTALLAPLLMIGVAAFGGNGLMLVIGSLFSNVGDVSNLIALGVSKGALLTLGLIFLCLGFIIFFLLQPYLGISQSDTFLKRSLILIGGLTPYMLTVLIYNWLFNAGAFKLYMIYILWSLMLALGAAFFTKMCHSYFSFKKMSHSIEISWRNTIFSIMLGVTSISLCFYCFSN